MDHWERYFSLGRNGCDELIHGCRSLDPGVTNGFISGATGSVSQRYNYDDFDNVILQSQNNGATTTIASYDSLNRATSVTTFSGSA